MKTLTIACAAVAASLSLNLIAAAPAAAPAAKPAAAAKHSDGGPSPIEKVGGFVYDLRAAKGKVVFLDLQKRFQVARTKNIINILREETSWIYEYSDKPVAIDAASADKVRTALGANVLVAIVDVPGQPALVALPECRAALVNVAALGEGLSAEENAVLQQRCTKEVMRAFAFAFGAGYTTYEAGVMQPAFNAAGLDAISSGSYTPDVVNNILQTGDKMGLKQIRRTTYLRAVKEGWAAAPTNDFQKAVWDRVHAIPANPIKIKYDPKTDK